VPIYGGLARVFQKRWLTILCFALMIITGFSRNYLGVHTPQDVLFGFLIGGGSLYAMQKLFGIATLIYITFKQYPTDYVNGELLVDPRKMMKDGYKDIGQFVAFCPARYLEKRFMKFRETGFNQKGIILCLIGMVPLFFIASILPSLLKKALDANIAAMTAQMTLTFYSILIWPAVIKLFQKNPE